MKRMIYADNAATTKLSKEALLAMIPYLEEEYGNASQPYSFSKNVKKALREARETIASCINASPEEIFFTSGGTESDNWAVKGKMLEGRDRGSLITTQIEHHAILRSADAVEKMGHPVKYLPVDSSGKIDIKTFQKLLDKKTKLASIMYANNEVGTIQPIKRLAMVAHEYGVLFHSDAVQAVGHVSIDVKDLDVDMLSASAHKFNGPKGTGFLYVKSGVHLNPFCDGGTQEFGKRAGTENVASIVGMAIALRNNCEKIEAHLQHLSLLEKELLGGLNNSHIDYIRNGSEDHIPGNISLSFKGLDGEMLLHRLDLMGICVSTGAACDSKETRVSHVLSAMKVPEEYAKGTIRISLGKDNTLDEIEQIVEGLSRITGYY